MKALVCGGHFYKRSWHVWHVLTLLHTKYGFTKIIHGDADGVDTYAGEWAWMNYIDVETYPANWNLSGRRAGHIRNVRMLIDSKPQIGIVFPGGPGTANMRRMMTQQAGIDIVDVPPFKAEDLL